MGIRSLSRALVAVVVLGHAGGCITITPAEQSKPAELQQQQPPAQQPGGVVQAGGLPPAAAAGVPPTPPAPQATAAKPASSMPTVNVSLPKINWNFEKKVELMEMAILYQPQLRYLADPSKNGTEGAGLVAQMFLYGIGPNNTPMPAVANGKLTISMYDETPSPVPGQPAKSNFIGSWGFEKDALKNLVAVDERLGRHYQVFMPWPNYSPEVTKVKMMARFEPEGGHTHYAPSQSLVIDTSAPGSRFQSTNWTTVPSAGLGGTMAPPSGVGNQPLALPPGFGAPSAPPAGLPPQAWR